MATAEKLDMTPAQKAAHTRKWREANRKADATALAQLKSERAKKAAVTRRKNERRI
jgi:hypothetical protein